ncbi:MAG: right-handed parallel beta-helix repeat-containing protein [Rikenellaceae bacterium]
MKRGFLILILLLVCAWTSLWGGGTIDEPTCGVKTGYYTCVLARESDNDMPRKFHLLIEPSGEITLLGYDRYSNDNTAQYSKLTFDPDQFLGRVVTIDYTGAVHTNNKQFNIQREDGSLLRIPKIRVYTINRMELDSVAVDVPSIYRYPNPDTLVMPHPVELSHFDYDFVASDRLVSLLDFVEGEGTADSPYVSEDGSSGLCDAISALGGAGTILVDRGVYQISSKGIRLPFGVCLRGVDEADCRFVFHAASDTWTLQGDNHIENLTVDITSVDRYCHTIMVDNFARNVSFSHFTVWGDYFVDSLSYSARGAVVAIGLASYISNVTLDHCSFHNVFRGLQSKGQRSHHGITVRDCLFDGFSYTPISLDQTSDITDVLIEGNRFLEFCHFGVAFARISNVVLRNNLFYSRRVAAVDTFNQAVHLEDHSNSFLIENNSIDVIMRRPNRANYRNAAISVSDGRGIIIRGNNIKNSGITMQSGETSLSGYSLIEGNTIDGGTIYLGEVTGVDVLDNQIRGSVSAPIVLSTGEAMQQPVSEVRVLGNRVSDFSGLDAVLISGFVGDILVSGNSFVGDNIMALRVDLSTSLRGIVVSDNCFRGVDPLAPLSLSGSELPSGFADEIVRQNELAYK